MAGHGLNGAVPVAVGDVDLAAVAVRFGRALSDAGIAVTPDSAARFARAISLAAPTRTTELYWLARTTLLTAPAHAETFDRVFDLIWGGLGAFLQGRDAGASAATTTLTPGRPPAAPSPGPPPLARPGEPRRSPLRAPSAERAPAEPPGPAEQDDAAVLAARSPAERLARRPFEACTPEELAQLQSLIAAFAVELPQRPARRNVAARHGRPIDLRATLRAARRNGGEPLQLRRRRARSRPRRLVVLADVSGSMEAYGRAYLCLAHSAVRAANAEAFAFATRLTRLTRHLDQRRAEAALRAAMAAAPDWSGGTRLGEALGTFLDEWGRRGMARGAVVVIVSDGWEGGDPALVARHMARLARLAHRIVWVNPRKQSARYAPLAGGMAAALPHIDVFLAGHCLEAMADVVAAIAAR